MPVQPARLRPSMVSIQPAPRRPGRGGRLSPGPMTWPEVRPGASIALTDLPMTLPRAPGRWLGTTATTGMTPVPRGLGGKRMAPQARASTGRPRRRRMPRSWRLRLLPPPRTPARGQKVAGRMRGGRGRTRLATSALRPPGAERRAPRNSLRALLRGRKGRVVLGRPRLGQSRRISGSRWPTPRRSWEATRRTGVVPRPGRPRWGQGRLTRRGEGQPPRLSAARRSGPPDRWANLGQGSTRRPDPMPRVCPRTQGQMALVAAIRSGRTSVGRPLRCLRRGTIAPGRQAMSRLRPGRVQHCRGPGWGKRARRLRVPLLTGWMRRLRDLGRPRRSVAQAWRGALLIEKRLCPRVRRPVLPPLRRRGGVRGRPARARPGERT